MDSLQQELQTKILQRKATQSRLQAEAMAQAIKIYIIFQEDHLLLRYQCKQARQKALNLRSFLMYIISSQAKCCFVMKPLEIILILVKIHNQCHSKTLRKLYKSITTPMKNVTKETCHDKGFKLYHHMKSTRSYVGSKYQRINIYRTNMPFPFLICVLALLCQ